MQSQVPIFLPVVIIDSYRLRSIHAETLVASAIAFLDLINPVESCSCLPVSKYLETHPRPKGAHNMPRRKARDAAKLIKIIEDETPQAEIMKKMGFKTSTQLKTAYMSALIAEGKVPAIKGGRGEGKAIKVKAIGVGKRGSIVISKDLVESLGLGAGDKFTVRKTKAGIALNKAEKSWQPSKPCSLLGWIRNRLSC